KPDIAGTRPREGLSPTRPVAAAGMRTDPPPSEPGANGSRPAATATAAPPLEPPALRCGSHGFLAIGPESGSVVLAIPNSHVAVLPRLIPPASSSTRASSSELSGT